MDYVCATCGHEQDAMDRKCDKCGSVRVVAVVVVEAAFGPAWRELCFPKQSIPPWMYLHHAVPRQKQARPPCLLCELEQRQKKEVS